MRKRILLLGVLSAILGSGPAAAVPVGARVFGNTISDLFTAVAPTAGGGLVLAGVLGTDPWLVQLDPAGSVQWEKTYQLATPIAGSPSDVRPTLDGGLVVAGTSEPTGAQLSWVIKIDAGGNLQWQTSMAGTLVGSVREMADGGFLVAGNDIAGLPDTDGWVLKLDAAGNFVWRNKTATILPLPDLITIAEPTADGGAIATGLVAASSLYVEKLSATGGQSWHREFTGDLALGSAVWQTADGGYMVVASTISTVFEGWLIKLDGGGAVQWQKRYGGTDRLVVQAAVATADGGAVFAGSALAGTALRSVLIRVDATGSIVWQRAYGYGVADAFARIAVVPGGFAVAGSTTTLAVSGGDGWLLVVDDQGLIPGTCIALADPTFVASDFSASTSPLVFGLRDSPTLSSENGTLAPVVSADSPLCRILLAVTFESVTAHPDPGGVAVRFRTVTEDATLAFVVYRSRSADGAGAEKVAAAVAARGSGASYEVLDRAPLAAIPWYFVEEWTAEGAGNRSPAVHVETLAPAVPVAAAPPATLGGRSRSARARR